MADRADRPPRPALDVHLPDSPPSLRPRLDALLDDYDPFAFDDAEVPVEAAGTARGRRRRVFFFSAPTRDQAAAAITEALGPDGVRVAPMEVPDDGWAERGQRDLRAVRVDDLLVAPPWDRPPVGPAAPHVIEIEPSTGFGTGHHASTRLALRALLRHRTAVTDRSHVVDVGTGSGVLAIAAATLGAARVTAIDRDPDALRNARHNVTRNRVGPVVTLVQMDVVGTPARREHDVARADVVLANVSRTLFERHGARLRSLLAPAGLLIASGFLTTDAPRVRAALTPALAEVARFDEDDWGAIVLRREPSGPGATA